MSLYKSGSPPVNLTIFIPSSTHSSIKAFILSKGNSLEPFWLKQRGQLRLHLLVTSKTISRGKSFMPLVRIFCATFSTIHPGHSLQYLHSLQILSLSYTTSFFFVYIR